MSPVDMEEVFMSNQINYFPNNITYNPNQYNNLNNVANLYPLVNTYSNDPYFRCSLAMQKANAEIMATINNHHEVQKEYEHIRDDKRWEEIISQQGYALNNAQPIFFAPINQVTWETDSNLFPSPLSDLATSIAQVYGMEYEAVLFAILHFFIISVHGRVHIKLDDTWSETMESYGVIIRRSGGRKTEFLRQLKQPFMEIQSELHKEWLAGGHDVRVFKDMKSIQRQFSKKIQQKHMGFTTYEKLVQQGELNTFKNDLESEIRQMYHATDKHIHSAQPIPTLFLTETTPKALLMAMFHNGGYIANVNSENTFFKKSFLDKIASYLLAAHDGEYLDDRTKTAGSYVLDHPGMSMLQLIQPRIAAMFYGNSLYSDIGLSQRCIPFFSSQNIEPNSYMQEQMLKMINSEYAPRIQALVKMYFSQDINAPKFKLQIEPSAYRLIKEYETSNLYTAKQHSFSPFESYIRKSHGQAVRYAAAIHAFLHAGEAIHETPLTYDEVRCGIGLMKILYNHAYYAFDPYSLQAHENAVHIVTALLRRTQGAESYVMTVSDINRMTHIKNKDIEAALMFLERNYLCSTVRSPGRATVVILHGVFYELANSEEWQALITRS